MATPITTETALRAVAVAGSQRSRLRERTQSFLLLLPSFVAVAIFVYVFISVTLYVSFSNWHTLKVDLSLRDPAFASYAELFASTRFQSDLRNTFIFTLLFILVATGAGLGLAILLDHQVFGRTFFRNVFLFPYALSFVVTGVAWRWIFNPETGINLFFNLLGINTLLAHLGLPPLQPGWITDPQVWFQVNGALAQAWPAAAALKVKLGVPAALIPVMLAAAWQLSGFVMAMYVGGMATIPDEVREAARMDGATEWQIYRRVIIPMLNPVTISIVVLLLHTSLKIFDLVFTMTGVGPGFATDVPAIFVFETMFKATRYNLAAAAAIFMLVLVGLVVIPYLARSLRED